uniref:Uncharacterized protein n=1 Tax=Knipowitschia caucasica TaxID=637954 RepID=A0AAV2KAP8_KNICA
MPPVNHGSGADWSLLGRDGEAFDRRTGVKLRENAPSGRCAGRSGHFRSHPDIHLAPHHVHYTTCTTPRALHHVHYTTCTTPRAWPQILRSLWASGDTSRKTSPPDLQRLDTCQRRDSSDK